MGEIWLAREVTLERMVALKVLRANLTLDPAPVTRFRQEARAASALNHPNVCTIYGLGETPDGQQFIAMEHIAGDTLRRRLAARQLPLHEALDIAVQVASALSAAHAAGVVHRDLKPENVMLRPDGFVKVVDFGLAKLAPVQGAGAAAALTVVNTEAGTMVGTFTYMSPEQTRGQEVDARTDIWSLGVMLYEMIAGRNPFAGQSSSDVLAGILGREPAPIARFEPDVPTECQRIVSKTLRKDREQRYQVMKDLLLDLQALRDDLSTGARTRAVEHELTQSPGTPALPTAPAAPNRARAPFSAAAVVTRLATHKRRAALVVCVLALLAAGAWWAVRGRPATSDPAVAVLPFGTIGDGEQYFADGITEAVTTELGRVGGVRVIASNSAFAVRSKAESLRDIGRELGVDFVVKGSVQRAGTRVRIDASLVNTRDETVLWTERYNKDNTDVLAVQDDIARQIALTLSRAFGGKVPAKPALVTNPDAYDAYLRGLSHLKGRASAASSGSSLVAAIEELERAVSDDRTFALAHATLASAYTQRFFYDATNPLFEQKAFLEIERALALDPNQAVAYLARAQLTWNMRNGFPHERAVGDLRRALSINPNLAEAYVELGKVYYHVGLTDKAVDANEQALRLDPSARESLNRKVLALIDAGRLDDVRRELDRNGARLGAYARGDALLAIGRTEDALQVLAPFESPGSNDPASALVADMGATALLGVVYAKQGRRQDANRMIEAARPAALNPTGLSHVHHVQFQIGSTLALIGRPEEAVDWLARAANEGYPSYPRFSTDQTLLPLKGHARFVALVERLEQEWKRWQKTL